MIYYESIKISINALNLAKVIINIVIRYHGLPDSIITNQGSLFKSKFWSLLCYFLKIKRKHFIAFYLQINGQTKRQNNTLKAYFKAFVNWEENDWARLFSMAKCNIVTFRIEVT